jgi:hypothetical protein
MKGSQKSLWLGVAAMMSASLVWLNQDIFALLDLSDGISFILRMTLSLLAVGALSCHMMMLRVERLDSDQHDEV